jgi:hypothetical protein
VPSGQTSDTTAQMFVCDAVLARRTSSAAGPALRRSRRSGAVAYERPSCCATVMSLSTGSAVVSTFSPALPAIAVLYGSLLVVNDGICG